MYEPCIENIFGSQTVGNPSSNNIIGGTISRGKKVKRSQQYVYFSCIEVNLTSFFFCEWTTYGSPVFNRKYFHYFDTDHEEGASVRCSEAKMQEFQKMAVFNDAKNSLFLTNPYYQDIFKNIAVMSN